MVNLENLEIDIAQRVLDFMSGAVYALNGNINKVTKRIDVYKRQILDMRLRRLTSLEVIALRKEHAEVTALIEELRGIVEDERKLVNLLVKELREIKSKYAGPRRTVLQEKLAIRPVEVKEAAASEPCDVIYTRKGYLCLLYTSCFPIRSILKSAKAAAFAPVTALLMPSPAPWASRTAVSYTHLPEMWGRAFPTSPWP